MIKYREEKPDTGWGIQSEVVIYDPIALPCRLDNLPMKQEHLTVSNRVMGVTNEIWI